MQNILIVYYSRTDENWYQGKIQNITVGNTAKVAGIMSQLTGFKTYEIKTLKPYPVSYQKCCEVAGEEIKKDLPVALMKDEIDMDDYDGIILGFPIWYGTFPQPVKVFLRNHKMAGKKIYPFSTSEGSLLGNSVTDLTKLCPDSVISHGLPLIGSKVESSEVSIKTWLHSNLLLDQ